VNKRGKDSVALTASRIEGLGLDPLEG